jgi:RNA polymerase sigma-70 factor (ECF subfamily)
MDSEDRELVAQARSGVEDAFTQLVLRYQELLKSYLYRLTACREDAEDLAQEVWIQSFTGLPHFEAHHSIRVWLLTIATQVARRHPRVKARWPIEAQDKARALAATEPEIPERLRRTHWESARARYEIREHIDFCFTCLLKTLALDEHIALMLCDIYHCSAQEAAAVLGCAPEAAESLLRKARATLQEVFAQRCSLINQQAACHHCTELNGLFNPHQAEAQELAKLDLVRAAQDSAGHHLANLRIALVRSIDPLNAAGTNLHEVMMRVVRQASGSES